MVHLLITLTKHTLSILAGTRSPHRSSERQPSRKRRHQSDREEGLGKRTSLSRHELTRYTSSPSTTSSFYKDYSRNKDALMYDCMHRYSVPHFHRWGKGRILGVDQRIRIAKDAPKIGAATYLDFDRLRKDRHRRYYDEGKGLTKEGKSEVICTRGSDQTPTASFIPLEEGGLKDREQPSGAVERPVEKSNSLSHETLMEKTRILEESLSKVSLFSLIISRTSLSSPSPSHSIFSRMYMMLINGFS